MTGAAIAARSCGVTRSASLRCRANRLAGGVRLFLAPHCSGVRGARPIPSSPAASPIRRGSSRRTIRPTSRASSLPLEQTSTDQLAVVTVKSLEGYSIEDYGIGLARKWGIGQKGKDNGILLIVAPNDRKVRIEVGRRLEPMMTDTMSALIIQNAILPKFRRGDFARRHQGWRARHQDRSLGRRRGSEAARPRRTHARRTIRP